VSVADAMPETVDPGAASCPALFVAAPASGQGKTTVTAALARLHTRLAPRALLARHTDDLLAVAVEEKNHDHPP